jgi:hypothetical protein
MRNFPGPRWSIVQQVQQQWSCCDQSPSGRLLVVEPDYLPDSEVCFSHAWTPFPNGGCGGDFPPQLSPGGSRGGDTIFVAPPGGGFRGKCTPEAKILGKIAL